ncbi:helix-turn-helix domain-containing protein [Umezawaea sp. NPDC059074]|uniref:helix-turn-helix domain-containing protein n=1 Tax=Umezawaea sp. NPDC059074 TaxID=3346716 RepID=UPI0036AA22DB
MESDNVLGAFLRARRELVRPEEVGLRSGGLRRVPGLRREEVALLAGISAEYYLRLERGRDRNPSTQVLDALAAVLQLDAESAAHLAELARHRPRARVPQPVEEVPDGVRMLLDTLTVPAFVVNRYRDVLAANRLAQALSPHMAPGENRLRALFTDPDGVRCHPDWEENAASLVAQLRAEVGADVDDPHLAALVEELSLLSDRFRRLWARHDVQRGGSVTTVVRHPRFGDLELRLEKFAVVGADRLLLVVYHAEPGSPAAEALALLDAGTRV